MLIEFSVENFGSIKDKQTLSFEATKDKHLEDYYIIPTKIKGLRLLKLGLIYGANASGKTTILLALNFLRNIVLNPKSEKNMLFKFEPFLFDKKTPGQNTIFNISFIQNNIRYDYEVELNKEAIVNEELYFHNPNRAKVFTRTTDIKKQYTNNITFGPKIKKNKNTEITLKANTLWNNTVLGGFSKTNIENSELKDVIDWFYFYLKPIILTRTELFEYVTEELKKWKNRLNDSIVKILRNADFDISNFILEKKMKKIPQYMTEILRKVAENSIWKNSKEFIDVFSNNVITEVNVIFEHTVNGQQYELPFGQESMGTQRYYELAVLLLLLIKNPIMFPIDELENSLHPDLFRHFLLSFVANSKNSQIIATTHNREILNDRDIFRKDAIWITDKNKESATNLYSLSDFDTAVIRDSTSIYNAYKIGKLGGIPNLCNHYIETE
jgi:AAA15 family ATPase/GTPase